MCLFVGCGGVGQDGFKDVDRIRTEDNLAVALNDDKDRKPLKGLAMYLGDHNRQL